MRLFIAVNFDQITKQKISQAADILKAKGVKGNFTNQNNYHITLLFLGQSDDYQTSAAKKAITQIKKDPFDIKLQNISNFGKNIIYLNVTDSVILQDINQYLFDTLKKDFLLEDNRFSPHITLVRKPNLIPQDVDISPFDFTVSEIALMQSIRIEGELIYKPIFSHKL